MNIPRLQSFKEMYVADYLDLFDILSMEHPEYVQVYPSAKIIVNILLQYMYYKNMTVVPKNIVAFSLYFSSNMKLKDAAELMGTRVPNITHALERLIGVAPQGLRRLGTKKFKKIIRDKLKKKS